MNDPTLVIHWVFTGVAVFIMTSRLFLKRTVFHSFDLADYLTFAAIICALARAGLIHVVLTWGTNNMTAAMRAKTVFTPQVVYQRTIGSKFAISNRPIYNTYLWLQKFVLFHFYIRYYRPKDARNGPLMWIYVPIFIGAYIAAFIVGFTECDPFHLYWQVVPAPGSCVRAQIQLIVLGVVNIVTDVMLLILPIPTLISLKTSWRLKLRLYLLVALGLIVIAVTIIRLPINHLNAAVQANRTTWASTELVTAAIVANAPIVYGALRKWRHRNEDTTATYTASSKRTYGDSGLNTDTSEESRTKNLNSKVSWASAGPHNKLEDDEELMFPIQGSTHAEVRSSESATSATSGAITRTIETDVHSFIDERNQRVPRNIEMDTFQYDYKGYHAR